MTDDTDLLPEGYRIVEKCCATCKHGIDLESDADSCYNCPPMYRCGFSKENQYNAPECEAEGVCNEWEEK